ncbi:MAG TPA: ABC transporter permease subunit [Solirubrobacterales bacterium]
MSTHAQTGRPMGLYARLRGGDSWSIGDRLGVAAAWGAGLLLCLIAAAIVLYMLIRGIQYLRLDEIFSHPVAGTDQSKNGGFLDPLEGTLLLTVIGTAIAAPVGVGIAVWLTEYGRPAALARAVESCIEIVAGTPSIVLAIFGLLVFQQGFFGFLSYEATPGVAFGRSFFTAGMVMSLIALPLIVGASREALHSIPRHVREASYALGKDRISTIRRVLLPASRRGIGTGVALGMGRIVGDTAIVVILLGASLQNDPEGSIPGLSLLQGTGSTLTTYVYNNSPVGEGGSPEKAYAAAFVLLLIVIGLNFAVDLITRGRGPSWTR